MIKLKKVQEIFLIKKHGLEKKMPFKEWQEKTSKIKDNNKILKNALVLIYHAGLLQLEIVNLNINDVEQNGAVINLIKPVNFDYPVNFRKEQVNLSQDARNLLIDHIKYIRTLKQFSPQDYPLFPCLLNGQRYNIHNLWIALKTHTIYPSYERHRRAGILALCWKMSCNDITKSQIISEAHRFSRYVSLKETENLVELGINRDYSIYEKSYENAFNASNFFIQIHRTRPDNLSDYLTRFGNNLISLDKEDQKAILDKINKRLQESRSILIWKGDKLFYEENIDVKIGKRSIIKESIKRKMR